MTFEALRLRPAGALGLGLLLAVAGCDGETAWLPGEDAPRAAADAGGLGGAVDATGAVDSAVFPDGPLGQRCRQALPIPLHDGFGTGEGQLVASDLRNEVHLGADECAGAATPGAEQLYAVELEAGKRYRVLVVPDPGTSTLTWRPALYVFTSCADIAGTCLAGAANAHRPEVSIVARSSGVHFIGVDSTEPAGTDRACGSYTVSVFEMAANDTCETAAKLSWSGSQATATATDQAASNTVKTACGLGPLRGPDLFYEVELTGGKPYRVSAPGAIAYVFADCSDTTGTCLGASDQWGPENDDPLFTAGTFFVFPDRTARYLIGLHPWVWEVTLTVEEVTPPANDRCEAAQPLTWSGSKATSASFDPREGTNTLDLGPGGCTGTPTPGPELFFKVDLKGGMSYRFHVEPNILASLYVLTDCSDPVASCVQGTTWGSSEWYVDKTLTMSASKTGTYIVGLDMGSRWALPSQWPAEQWTLTVEEFAPPANNSCAQATPIFWSQGKASTTVDLHNAFDTFDLGELGCAGSTPGPDVFYEIELTGGMGYTIRQSWEDSYGMPVSVYVLSSCTPDPSSCIAGRTAKMGTIAAPLSFIAPTTGTYIIVVDGQPFWAGTFLERKGLALEVVSFTPVANDSCSTPQPLSFSDGAAVAQGDTGWALNRDLAGVRCGAWLHMGGSQLYYSAPLQAQKSYLAVLLEPVDLVDLALAIYAFPASTACTKLAIDPACYYTFGRPFFGFTSQTAADWVFAVASSEWRDGVSFTLRIEELAPAWVSIPAGTFVMGSPASEPCRQPGDEPEHQVTLTRSFEIQSTETTQAEFQALMGYHDYHHMFEGVRGGCVGKCPYQPVTWHEAVAYCNALSAHNGLAQCYTCSGSAAGGPFATLSCSEAPAYSGQKIYDCPGYRLPTEAEWEYAYRAGTQTAYHNGPNDPGACDVFPLDANLDQIAWYDGSFGAWYGGSFDLGEEPWSRPVAQKQPNAWGLYDMAGNAAEWCHDWYGSLGPSPAQDPWGAAPAGSTQRVFRGGAWSEPAALARAAARRGLEPSECNIGWGMLGFRCARTQ